LKMCVTYAALCRQGLDWRNHEIELGWPALIDQA
jgi:hypothetical protein